MKTTFYTNLVKRLIDATIKLSLVILSILVFNSCKKELFTGEKESLTISQTGAVKVSNINYSSFLEKVNLNSLGTLKTAFQSNGPGGKLMSLGGGTVLGGLGFLTDSIKQMATVKGNSYVFRMPQTSATSRVFQNLTISVLKDTTIAFITTYTPKNEWIISRNNKIYKPYIGHVAYTPISLSTALGQQLPLLKDNQANYGKVMAAVPNKTMESITICNTFVVYSEVIYGCSQGNHMPDDPTCPWNFGPAPPGEHAGGTMYIAIPLTFCSSIAIDNGGNGSGTGGGGPSGGGGETTPYPPEGYNPCEPGLPCTELFGESAAQMFANQIGLTDFNHIAFLGDPANVNILGTLKNYYTAYGSSTENKEFLRWAVEFIVENNDVGFIELVEMNSIPNSTISLPNIIDVTHLNDYPAFKSMVENLPAFLNQNQEVLNSLSRYTGFSKTKIMQLIQPGKGPKVELVSNLSYNSQPAFGQYTPGTYILKINKELVVGLDKVQSPKRYKALGMLLAITTLHEFVHYGRDINKLTSRIPMNGTTYEAGLMFELSISPPNNYQYINRNNAIEWANFYKFNIND